MRSCASRHQRDSRGTCGVTYLVIPRRYAAWKVTRRYCAITGVWSAKSGAFAMGGELSFCINDLAACRGDLKEVARLVLRNYHGVTSAEVSIRKSFGDSRLRLRAAFGSPDRAVRYVRKGFREGTAWGPWAMVFQGALGRSPGAQMTRLGRRSVVLVAKPMCIASNARWQTYQQR